MKSPKKFDLLKNFQCYSKPEKAMPASKIVTNIE